MRGREEVEAIVTNALVSALEVEPGEVVPSARIMVELGAESIDILDLRFRLEEALEIAITDDLLRASFGTEGKPEDFREQFTVGALCDWLVALTETPRD